MSTWTKTGNHRFDYTKKWHADVWKAMQKVLENEAYDKTLTDVQLTDAVMAEGVYATDVVVREVRIEHSIGNADERRIANYARDFKKGKIAKKEAKE